MLKLPNADESKHFSLNERENPTCQGPQWGLLIDFHGSWFSLITAGVSVKMESEASDETLLPTWISGGIPKLTDIHSFTEGFVKVVRLTGISQIAGGQSAHTHPDMVLLLLLLLLWLLLLLFPRMKILRVSQRCSVSLQRDFNFFF